MLQASSFYWWLYQPSVSHLALGNQLGDLRLGRYFPKNNSEYHLFCLSPWYDTKRFCPLPSAYVGNKWKSEEIISMGNQEFSTNTFLYQPINRLETEAVSPPPSLIKIPYWKVNSLWLCWGLKEKNHPPPVIHSTTLVPRVQKDMHGKNARVS